MESLNVLSIIKISRGEREMIEAVSPVVQLTDSGGWFDGEIRETWPSFTSERYLAPNANGEGSKEERDRLLADADVILGGWPFPLDLCARAPKLKWFHQRPAGASNLLRGDLWGGDVMVTTSRGSGNTLAMAEFALAGIMHFAKGLPQAAVDYDAGIFSHRAYNPLLLHDKKVCVVGVGGIGQDVGRLCSAIGMRVVGTRSSQNDEPTPQGFDFVGGPDDLDRLLVEADFVVICCQWTPETNHLFNAERFSLMKPGSVLVNVARGEIIEETALIEALQMDRLRGVVLDVYDGEFEGLPKAELWSDPRVLVTPHISGASDQNRHRAVEVFCENLGAYLNGQPLANVIDWERGY